MAEIITADEKKAPTLFKQNQRIILKSSLVATQMVGKTRLKLILSKGNWIVITGGIHPSPEVYYFTRENENHSLRTLDGNKVLWSVAKEELNKQK